MRIRHMITRKYLAVFPSHGVTLTSQRDDPNTVFRLHPVVKVCRFMCIEFIQMIFREY